MNKTLAKFPLFKSVHCTVRLCLHVPSTSPFFVPFNNGCFLHITSKRSKVPLTKVATLMVRVNEPFVCQ